MDEKELNELLIELSKKLKDVGIPISTSIYGIKINKRAKARVGACKINKERGKVEFLIEISSMVLHCKKEEIETIIIHELLHTCKDCFNHGKKWKEYCLIVKDQLGYEITSTINYEKLGLEKERTKKGTVYVVSCSGCGQEYMRKRICPLVRNPENYKCGKCGKRLFFKGKINI